MTQLLKAVAVTGGGVGMGAGADAVAFLIQGVVLFGAPGRVVRAVQRTAGQTPTGVVLIRLGLLRDQRLAGLQWRHRLGDAGQAVTGIVLVLIDLDRIGAIRQWQTATEVDIALCR
ncbi:hypothetical protein [Nitrincola alkalilacustris]|uniref:hypothetical protein n=1 Tax=Nitrincola alkalilacustris TaxID=1571224 RepID=UPI0014575B1A|nr:hypothetical protein [Nitrincola alkalilacustris]